MFRLLAAGRRDVSLTTIGLFQPPTQEALDETLARLTKKPGVKATIVLDRNTGAMLKTSGQVSSIRSSRSTGAGSSLSAAAAGDEPSGAQAVEELSALVWNFIKAAGMLVDEIDEEVSQMTWRSCAASMTG